MTEKRHCVVLLQIAVGALFGGFHGLVWFFQDGYGPWSGLL